jgi:hypothetical protein
MSSDPHLWIAAAPPTIVCEHTFDHTLVQQTKTAIRRLATEKGIDLAQERVSPWRRLGVQDFEHLVGARSSYQVFKLAETLAEDLFLFDARAVTCSPW